MNGMQRWANRSIQFPSLSLLIDYKTPTRSVIIAISDEMPVLPGDCGTFKHIPIPARFFYQLVDSGRFAGGTFFIEYFIRNARLTPVYIFTEEVFAGSEKNIQ